MDSQSIAHVHIVDDDASVRESLEFLIKSLGWKAYTYKSAKDFLEGYSACGKDCLLLDVHLPDMSGLELQEIVNSQDLDVSTILMTGYGDVPTAVKAMKLGAVDFLEKPVDQQALVYRVRSCLELNERISNRKWENARRRRKLDTLTERERQILDQLIEGKLNKVIAADLGISARTVEIHRAHIMKKLQVKSLAELVKLYMAANGNKGLTQGRT